MKSTFFTGRSWRGLNSRSSDSKSDVITARRQDLCCDKKKKDESSG